MTNNLFRKVMFANYIIDTHAVVIYKICAGSVCLLQHDNWNVPSSASLDFCRMQAISMHIVYIYNYVVNILCTLQGIDISNRIFYFLDPFGFNKISSSALDHFK